MALRSAGTALHSWGTHTRGAVPLIPRPPRILACAARFLPPAANDRADQRDLPVDSFFSYTSEGAGVDIYVLDSGIAADHVEFDTRVETALAANFDNSSTSVPRWGDCAGHGTFVASQAAGNFVGMALSARIIPVRVFNCAGQASLSSLVSAVDYIISTAAAQGRKSVINFSGGGGAYGARSRRVWRWWLHVDCVVVRLPACLPARLRAGRWRVWLIAVLCVNSLLMLDRRPRSSPLSRLSLCRCQQHDGLAGCTRVVCGPAVGGRRGQVSVVRWAWRAAGVGGRASRPCH